MTAKKRPDTASGEQDVRPGLVTAMFDRVRLIKRKHPDISRRIDGLEGEIREKLMAIKDAIDEFPSMEKELVTVLVINGVHKMCDEILIDSDDVEE
ncbi:MAG: hypothetical protein IT461_15340 [Planctomycetes bacterium]|jgi:hypothetical protein|nr:hypothetical protein [Planctomycetota bacterium]